MQHTVRNIPPHVDRKLREVAKRRGISLNEATLIVLRRGLGLSGKDSEHRDLDAFAGTWVEDNAFDEAVADFRRVDAEKWQ